MAYQSDVAFLERTSPPQIDQTADEYMRLARLLAACDDDFLKAERTDWQSDQVATYLKRLREASQLADHLRAAFKKVGNALSDYAEEAVKAKRSFDSGVHAEERLAGIIAREDSRDEDEAPMRQWEDMRESDGFLDWISDIGTDPETVRADAEREYNNAKWQYDDAKRVEHAARVGCVRQIESAFRSLPDFRSGDFGTLSKMQTGVRDLLKESGAAADDPLSQLPGTGMKTDVIPTAGKDQDISPKLQEIVERSAGKEAEGNYLWFPSDDNENREQYISANKQILTDAAEQSGLPPEMLAGIAWQEVEGDPSWTDDVYPWGRENLPFTSDPDLTSVGPMSVQVRRAAEVLGYDPANLTDGQREQVLNATKDPTTNVYIAAEYLAQLKAESEYADVPPESMTREQMQDLAARYNGGPDPLHLTHEAQAYGRGFANTFDQSSGALRR